MLTKEHGTVIREPSLITKEDVEFYKKLLGQTTTHMPVTQPEVLKVGPVLIRSQYCPLYNYSLILMLSKHSQVLEKMDSTLISLNKLGQS